MTKEQFKTELSKVDFNFELNDDVVEMSRAANHYELVYRLALSNAQFWNLFSKFNPTLINQ